MKINLARFGAFGAIYFFWGATYFAIKIGLQTIPPFLLMTLRCSLGGVLLLLTAGFVEKKRLSFRLWKRAAVSGVLLFLGCHELLAFAEQRVPSGFAAVVLATIPFWIVLLTTWYRPGEVQPVGPS